MKLELSKRVEKLDDKNKHLSGFSFSFTAINIVNKTYSICFCQLHREKASR